MLGYDADDADDGWENDVVQGNAATDFSHAGEALSNDEVEAEDTSMLAQLRAHHK
jgi:hypothetical protein